jgi:CRISPR/Cas system-associated exonuclease Cas4 (RecB family)
MRKFQYGVIEKLESKVENVPPPFWIGDFIHYVMERYYMSKPLLPVPTKGMLQGEFEIYKSENPARFITAETESLVIQMLYGHFKKYHEIDSTYDILGVEEEIEVEIDGVTIQAHLDLRRKKDALHEVVDHKNLARFPDEDMLGLDQQITGYFWLCREYGIPIDKFILNTLKKSEPTEPTLLKNESLSKSKTMDTTYDKYMEAIEARNLDPLDYDEYLNYLISKPDNFYQRYVQRRSEREIDSYDTQLRLTIPRIKDDIDTGVLIDMPSVNPITCSFCQYKRLCKLDSDQTDTSIYKQHHYDVREDNEPKTL